MKHTAKLPVFLIVILGLGLTSQSQNAAGGKEPVTAVTGESWLNHLHRPFAETSMGKTWRLGPPAPETATQRQSWQGMVITNSRANVTLHGSDLYRLNCQGCHGETGEGAPPEINSLIDPVRATSVSALVERMKKTGAKISQADAKKMAQQSQTALIQRLHDGGKNMPAFPHLRQAEIRSLLAYLKELAGLTGGEKEQAAVNESPARIGELIVKSTCHTCHSAVGSNPTPQQLLDGAIPPLSSLASRVDEEGLIRKVTYGTPITMGTPPLVYRGRMPVFDYLSRQEAADVYIYLASYPPSQAENQSDQIIASAGRSTVSAGTPPTSSATSPAASSASTTQPVAGNREQPLEARSGLPMKTVALLLAVYGFVLVLLGGSLGFTIREFKRLTKEGERRIITRAGAQVLQFPERRPMPRQKVGNASRPAIQKAIR